MQLKPISLGLAAAAFLAAPLAHAASPEVYAAENNLSANVGYNITHYSENLTPGDSEAGDEPGFGVGGSYLGSSHPGNPGALDFYTALNYQFNAGSIKYTGHYLYSGDPVDATDNAVFQRIEARIGAGFPIIGGGESIPFLVGGYQSWNRNINNKGQIGTDEFYHSGLLGLGWKFDQPVGDGFTLSALLEGYGLVGGGITATDVPPGIFPATFNVTPEINLEFEADKAFGPHLHLFYRVSGEHFTYSGTRIDAYTYYYEPSSETTQGSFLVGAKYSF
jgi:hypothetical protein